MKCLHCQSYRKISKNFDLWTDYKMFIPFNCEIYYLHIRKFSTVFSIHIGMFFEGYLPPQHCSCQIVCMAFKTEHTFYIQKKKYSHIVLTMKVNFTHNSLQPIRVISIFNSIFFAHFSWTTKTQLRPQNTTHSVQFSRLPLEAAFHSNNYIFIVWHQNWEKKIVDDEHRLANIHCVICCDLCDDTNTHSIVSIYFLNIAFYRKSIRRNNYLKVKVKNCINLFVKMTSNYLV